jgi:hypothetical protein
MWLTLKTIWWTIYGNDLGNYMVAVDDVTVKRCVEPKATVLSTHRFTIVIYINRIVSKVVTMFGQPYRFQGQPHGSRSTMDPTTPILLTLLLTKEIFISTKGSLISVEALD